MPWSNTDKSARLTTGPSMDDGRPDVNTLDGPRLFQPGRVMMKGLFTGHQRLVDPATKPRGRPSLAGLLLRPHAVSGDYSAVVPRDEGGDHVVPAGPEGNPADGRGDYRLADHGYGKSSVKLLHVRRQGARHTIREYEVDTRLRLRTQRDFVAGDNRDIIATDTQKNTVHVLAKKHGVQSPEDFALLLCGHFLYKYDQLDEASVHVEEYPWERLSIDSNEHNHAFIFSPKAMRVCTVTQRRNEPPRIEGGLRNLRVLKTTQSAFTDFVHDEYRTLPDADDRIFSTVVSATWEFSTAAGVEFDNVWDTVKECILDKFAGPPDKGIFSPSVQNTLYLTEKMILDQIPQIRRVEMQMPNKHYFTLDMSKFPASLVRGENKEVYEPVDKPSGIIHAALVRRETSKL